MSSTCQVNNIDIDLIYSNTIEENIISINTKKELFFDVYECVVNNKKLILEKVGESDLGPKVLLEINIEGKKYSAEAVLVDNGSTYVELNKENIYFIRTIPEETHTIEEEKEVVEVNINEEESSDNIEVNYENIIEHHVNNKLVFLHDLEEQFEEKLVSLKDDISNKLDLFFEKLEDKKKVIVEEKLEKITTELNEKFTALQSELQGVEDFSKKNIDNILQQKVNEIDSSVGIFLDGITKEYKNKIISSDKKITHNFLELNSIKEKLKENNSITNKRFEDLNSLKEKLLERDELVLKNEELKKFINEEFENIDSKFKNLSEEENKKYDELLAAVNNKDVVEYKTILKEKIQDVELTQIKESLQEEISSVLKGDIASLKRYVEMSSGGGSNAVQYADGGTMNGNLNVNGDILSGGTNLIDIFNSGTSINLQDVTDIGNTTTNLISSNNTIIADTILATNILSATNLDIGFELSGFNVTGSLSASGGLSADNIVGNNVFSGGLAVCTSVPTPSTPTLQAVTDEGNTTTNSLSVGGLSATKITGGVNSTNTGATSFIGGGKDNEVTGNCSTVIGGICNKAYGTYTTVIGGIGNKACGNGSVVVAGGYNYGYGLRGNTAKCTKSIVLQGGGYIGANLACGNYSLVGNGVDNAAVGTQSSVLNGYHVRASGYRSTVINGQYNCACGDQSLIGSGLLNKVCGTYSTVIGGYCNVIDGSGAAGKLNFIGNGRCNKIPTGACYSSVVGGYYNAVQASNSTVVGGSNNKALSGCSFIGGGSDNCANGTHSSVIGGKCNCAKGTYSTAIGGFNNTACNNCSTVIGGFNNLASGINSSVGGGYYNTASGNNSVIVGGRNAYAVGSYSFIGSSGYQNRAKCTNSFIGNGIYNCTNGHQASVVNGYANRALGNNSSVVGGIRNQACASNSTVVGGGYNCAIGVYSSIVGGSINKASGTNSFIAGGTLNCINAGHTNSFIIGTGITSNAACTTFVNNLSSQGIVNGCSITSYEGIKVGSGSIISCNASFTPSLSDNGKTLLLDTTSGSIVVTVIPQISGFATRYIKEAGAAPVVFSTGTGLSGLYSYQDRNQMSIIYAQADIFFKSNNYAFLGGNLQ